VVPITHQMQVVRQIAGRVAVIDGGRLVEQGTHAELLAHGGLYARLHAMQFRT